MRDATDRLSRFAALGALAAVLAFFAVAAPGFATLANVERVLVNHFALLAIAALGMTLALSIGAIDLSLGTAIDVASLAFVCALAHRAGCASAALAGLGAALALGAANALLVTRLGIAPFRHHDFAAQQAHAARRVVEADVDRGIGVQDDRRAIGERDRAPLAERRAHVRAPRAPRQVRLPRPRAAAREQQHLV